MPERVEKTKWGGGVQKQKLRGVYRRGVKKTKCGGGDLREDMPERGKKTKCGGSPKN